MKEFPKWKYHVDGASLIVQNADEESDLGEGWHNSPTEVDQALQAEQIRQQDQAREQRIRLDALRESAKEIGLDVDVRWSADDLEDRIKSKIVADGQKQAQADADAKAKAEADAKAQADAEAAAKAAADAKEAKTTKK